MKNSKRELIAHIANVVTIALIVECFLCSIMAVRKYAREDCLERMEETTIQVAQMFRYTMEDRWNRLDMFADILAANASNPDTLLMSYMENFCATDYFSAVCIHRANGQIISYGEHPHELTNILPFREESARLPYTSEVFSQGDTPEERCFYRAVPVIRDGENVGVLYGYIFLNELPEMVSTTAYGGACRIYMIDGDTGDYMMDNYHETLGNVFDGSMDTPRTRAGYEVEEIRDTLRNGESGHIVFQAQRTGTWQYNFYTPIGIKNWSMQLSIDEPTAFASYEEINGVLLLLAVCVIVLMILHVLALMGQNAWTKQRDRMRLQKSQYINKIQRLLLNVHHNPEYMERALKIVAEKNQAESALLLTVDDQIVNRVYCWPSRDQDQAQYLLKCRLRSELPAIYDQLAENQSIIYPEKSMNVEFSQRELELLQKLEVRNAAITPILDSMGRIKGVLCAANAEGEVSAELLECITYDLYMAITNMDNHAIIQQMGTMDYLTKVKNRNSYERDLDALAVLGCSSLWCVFIDVNGLHEINNTRGHKAGDLMLCAVADAVRGVFGSEHTYRVGGDEFVSFVTDSTSEELEKKKATVEAELAAKDYFVSIGIEGISKSEQGRFNVERVVKDAETVMYREKRDFYEKNNLPTGRNLPEQQDQESLLEAPGDL